jgi:hypothetical protein
MRGHSYVMGDCRRYPTFVKKQPGDWCGEHRQIMTGQKQVTVSVFEPTVQLHKIEQVEFKSEQENVAFRDEENKSATEKKKLRKAVN